MTTVRRRKQRLSFAGDQRIEDQPQLIHQPRIDKARRNPRSAHEIDVLAGLLLEGSDIRKSSNEACLWPASRSHGARQHIMRGLRGEPGPFNLSRRGRAASDPDGLARLVPYRRPILFVAWVHASPNHAGVYL